MIPVQRSLKDLYRQLRDYRRLWSWSALFILSFHTAFSQSPADHVNPFIGTGSHGHTFPGAVLPFGMVQLSPDTRIDGSWDGCSGYHYSDKVIYGFSHTHLSGTGVSDWGDVMLMPFAGKKSSDRKVYSSSFDHKNEKAGAGYYSVKLDDDDILAELTATLRTGLHRYSFNGKGERNVIFDMSHRDQAAKGSYIKITGDRKAEGLRRSSAWARDQYVYFAIEFSEPFAWEMFDGDKSYGEIRMKDNYYPGENVKTIFSFGPSQDKPLMVKVSISSVSAEGAWKNMESEMKDWDFDRVRSEARDAWNRELGKITVTDPDKDKLAVFYTALYHCMIHPSLFSDADGRYRGMDNKIHQADGYDHYTVFSLWDTFRALHPLLGTLDPKRTGDFIRTMLEMYKQSGHLPVWELSGNETDCMIGYHAVSVIADAWAKGIRNFDHKLAADAMVATSLREDYRGLGAYSGKGYLETEDESESVSKTLEYAYNDWCIDQFLSDEKDYRKAQFAYRSRSWRNLYDPLTGFMRPRSNGGWMEPFDPRRVDNNYTEANAWQYSFFVPHEPEALMEMTGGPGKFAEKLDSLFGTSTKTTGREQADITGLIGQYAHGNEPSHHMIYLYNIAGRPYRTQEYLHRVMEEFYKNSPDGLIGNEDCGQMSAWYVFGAMGFYPLCPGSTVYEIGKPLFEKMLVQVPSGSFSILSDKKGKYVGEYYLNGQKGNAFRLDHADLKKGGSLEFRMQEVPEKKQSYSRPGKEGLGFLPAPLITAPGKVFRDSLNVSISSSVPGCRIWYRTDKDMSHPPLRYVKPFTVHESVQVTAYADLPDGKLVSTLAAAEYFLHAHPSWETKLTSLPHPTYAYGGAAALTDGLRGDLDWRKGGWLGFQGKDFVCEINMKDEQEVREVGLGLLSDVRSWIVMPVKIIVETSKDGKKWKQMFYRETGVNAGNLSMDVGSETVWCTAVKPVRAKFIRVRAQNFGKLPSSHPGAGGEAFIFIDEILVK